MFRQLADAIAAVTEPSSIPDPPELTSGFDEARILESRLTSLVETAEKRVPSQRSPAAMFLGSDIFAEELSGFVTAAQGIKSGSDIFVAALAHAATIQRELYQQRKDLDELVAAKFVAPTRSFIARDVARVRDARRAHESAKRAFESARDRATAAAAIRLPDPVRLQAAEAELNRATERYREAIAAARAETEDLALKKELVFLSDVRALLALQLDHFRRCAEVLQAASPLMAQLEEHAREKAKALEDAQATRKQMAERKAQDALISRFGPLVGLASSPSMELLSVADAVPAEVAEQLVASMSRILDVQEGQIPLRLIRDAITASVDAEGAATATPETPAGSSPVSPLTALRETSAWTRLMSGYAKLHCRRWLGDVLRGPVAEIIETPDRFEIDPAKLPEAEKEKASEHVAALTGACGAILKALQASEAPPQVRAICAHLSKEVSRRRGEAAGDLAVGAFLFLRIICPAVINFASPATSPAAARALMLVAKVLQSIASEKSFFLESSMQAVEEFVKAGRGQVREWYSKLCAVTEEQIAAAPALSTRENVEISDLPLLNDLLQTHFKNIARVLLPTNKAFVVRLCQVLVAVEQPLKV